MLHSSPELPQHLILAIDHHQQLVEEAQRQRLLAAAHESTAHPQRRWRRLRFRVGDLLIHVGQRLKTDTVCG